LHIRNNIQGVFLVLFSQQFFVDFINGYGIIPSRILSHKCIQKYTMGR
jgi:hypothetical protein